MINQKVLCRICLQTISHPICEKCYLKHIDYLLNETVISSKMKKSINKQIKRVLFYESINEDTCIICNKEALSICSYCFFLQASRVLSDCGFTDDQITEFFGVIDYKDDSLFNEQISDIQLNVKNPKL